MARDWGLLPGMSLDSTEVDPEDGRPWDFNDARKREKAENIVAEKGALLLIGSPMCGAFSKLQGWNVKKYGEEWARNRIREATRHLRFCMHLYRVQMEKGLYFLHEHPAGATSWSEKGITGVLGLEGVETTISDRCQYDQESRDGEPMKKATRWMSNAAEVLRALSRRCTGRGGMCSRPRGGNHRVAEGSHTRGTQVYPFALCKAILQGCRNQLRASTVHACTRAHAQGRPPRCWPRRWRQCSCR